MNLQKLKDCAHKEGFLNTTKALALNAANRVMILKVLKAVKITAVNPQYLHCNAAYQGRFLDRAALAPFAGRGGFDLSPEFLDEAFARGDQCYGFMAGDMLAAYGWYAFRPTPIDLLGLVLHFSPPWVYMYKGFTHPEHRGQRLHAVGMTRALQAFRQRGLPGILSYVEECNFDSLRSCYRMGYTDFGRNWVVGWPNHHWLHASRGCKVMDFRLERPAAPIASAPPTLPPRFAPAP